jgi:NADH-quinone oxidoreductase subunit C
MMDMDRISDALQRSCKDESIRLREGLGGELFADVPAGKLVVAVQAMLQEGHLHHFSTISALDTGQELEVLYHFWLGRGVTLRVRCPKTRAILPTLVELIPAADWYEREVHELLGIEFAGHPGLVPLLLPDDWDAPPPLLSREDVR